MTEESPFVIQLPWRSQTQLLRRPSHALAPRHPLGSGLPGLTCPIWQQEAVSWAPRPAPIGQEAVPSSQRVFPHCPETEYNVDTVGLSIALGTSITIAVVTPADYPPMLDSDNPAPTATEAPDVVARSDTSSENKQTHARRGYVCVASTPVLIRIWSACNVCICLC